MNHHPTELYTVEPTADGGWKVIHRKWRRPKLHQPRPAPIERIINTFHGPDAETLARELVAKHFRRIDKSTRRKGHRPQ